MSKSQINLPKTAFSMKANLPNKEPGIIEYWQKINLYEKLRKKSKGKEKFILHDGPPYANGNIHMGTALNKILKDIITKFHQMDNKDSVYVPGWDCHGLPVEHEIDKTFGIKGKADVLSMGIGRYNEECRSIVMRYSSEWRKTITRVGRWIDFDNDYKTLDPTFMESVWWVFKQLFDKSLVYRGFKVMPYSTACNTPLSNFEAGLDYRDVSDPAILVKFPVCDQNDTYYIASTTTPWTRPANMALCVNPEFDYCYLQNPEGQLFIVSSLRLSFIPGCTQKGKGEKLCDGWQRLKTVKGSELAGTRYMPLFENFLHEYRERAFVVACDPYVSNDSGTGVVHQAPAYGEDDYRVCLQNGIIIRGDPLPDPVDANGCFTKEAPDSISGMYIKDADKTVIRILKEKKLLLDSARIVHSYPFCWRSKTPLIYRAVSSYFVRVEQIKSELLKNNAETKWVPAYVQEKRFHNWIEGARDWAISRNRYWGTPIPIWQSPDGNETIVVGSISELEELTGCDDISDIHRHKIDHLTIPSQRGEAFPPLQRVEDVFDCWFESGSMPYAQQHYPFENSATFKENFPADFIAEGLDQTRGWFYTLMVLSTALFDRPAFKNLICNGLVLAADGKKMSKSLKNYPDPNDVINKYGADALRLYLINSPVVRAEPLRFKEDGVFAVLKDVFLPWYNAYRFLIQNVSRLEVESNITFSPEFDRSKLDNPLDNWILAESSSLVGFIKREMREYRLYTVVPRLVQFIGQLTNIYVRYNRGRLKGNDADSQRALRTLYYVLLTLCKSMAPFTPFFVESMYQNLKRCLSDAEESVHFCDFPSDTDDNEHVGLQIAVSRMQSIIEMGRVIRERRNKPIKLPLSRALIVHSDERFLNSLSAHLTEYVKSELNIQNLEITNEASKYISRKAQPNFATLGKRAGKRMKSLKSKVENFSDAEIERLRVVGEIEVDGMKLGADDVLTKYEFNRKLGDDEDAICDADGLMLCLNLDVDQTLQDEGLAREVVNRVQKLRKSAGLFVHDAIDIFYRVEGGPTDAKTDILRILATDGNKHFAEAFENAPKDLAEMIDERVTIAAEVVALSNGVSLALKLVRCNVSCSSAPVGFAEYLKCREYANLRANVHNLQIHLDGEQIKDTILRNLQF